MILGSGDDADLLFRDDGVAQHHCALSVGSNGVALRAIDADVTVAETRMASKVVASKVAATKVRAGEQSRLPLPCSIELGTIMLRVGDAATLAAPAAIPAVQARPRWTTLLVTLACVGFLVVTVYFAMASIGVDRSAQTVMDDDKPAQTSAANGGMLLALNEEPAPESADPALAHQVAEVLRLSGVPVEARMLGAGRVEVTGHFGTGEAMSERIHSRAIKDIAGLDKVVVRNLDRDTSFKTRIVSVVLGEEPYAVDDEGSRYYVGATFPNGYRLAAIEDNDLILETSYGSVRAKGSDAWSIDSTRTQ